MPSRLPLRSVCAWLIVLICLFGALPVWALQITDARGITIGFAQSPQRIVSLLPSLTETVCELGRCARLVGVDRYSNYPLSVKKLPQVGGGLDPSLEAVLALKPDVVLLATSSRASAQLEALGLKVVALEPKTHAEMRQALEQLGQLLEVPDALRIWRNMDAGVTAVAQSLPPKVPASRVYFEVSPAPHGASEASFLGETLARLGVANIVPGSMGPFPKLNPEFVVRANPDVLMSGLRSSVEMHRRPGWGSMTAIRQQRICAFTSEENDILVRPGPRLAQAARLLAECLRNKAP